MHRPAYKVLAAGALVAGALSLSACGRNSADLINGKAQFVNHCGACHTLARADTKGIQGPNLDHAFVSDRRDGMNAQTIQGVVRHQIGFPRRGSIMPANLVRGNDARDVAAYVGFAAGEPGQDQGPLAEAGKPKVSGKPAVEQNGKLTIDAIDGTAFSTAAATAKAGKVTVVMPNKSSLGHNIALQGVSGAAGKVVQQGGTSTFTVNLKPGKYVFYCQVPGHEQAGMKGTLTVK